jgi:hypothetical protein
MEKRRMKCEPRPGGAESPALGWGEFHSSLDAAAPHKLLFFQGILFWKRHFERCLDG